MTYEEHNEKTRRQNPEMFVKRAQTISKAVVQEFVGCGKKVEFTSAKRAMEETGVSYHILLNVLNGDGILNGDESSVWSWKEQDIPGEKWYKITFDATEDWHPMGIRGLVGLDVSDQGRVKLRGRYTYGILDDRGMMVIGYNGHITRVHQAICLAFHGPPPEADLIVRHINGDFTDNNPNNLRWCTRKGDPPSQWCSRGWEGTKRTLLKQLASELATRVGMRDEDQQYKVHMSVVKLHLAEIASKNERVAEMFDMDTCDYNPYMVAKNILSKIGIAAKRRDRKCKRANFHVLVLTRRPGDDTPP
jgi:hypothetical protein